MTIQRTTAALVVCLCLSLLTSCGGGGGTNGSGSSAQADGASNSSQGSNPGLDKGPEVATFADGNSTYAPGEAVTIATGDVSPGEVTVDVDGTPVPVDQQDGSHTVVVLPNLGPGTHTLTVHVHGSKTTLVFEVTALQLAGDARQKLLDLINEALAQLDADLAANPGDSAAASLRDRLASAAAALPSLTQQELEALHAQFASNDLPDSSVPGSCNAAIAQYKVRLRKMLNTASLTSWLASRHATVRTSASAMAALLAEARMEEAFRRLVSYADTAMQLCGSQDALAFDTKSGGDAREHAAGSAMAAGL